MSKTFTISEAKEMVGTVIPRIELVVGRTYERKTGKGKYGEWSLQGAMSSDPTGDMKILFKQLPDQKSLSGRKLIFKSMETKHGLKGIEVKANEYNGKTTLELHVSEVALIVGTEEEGSVSTVTPSTRMPQNEPQTASVTSGIGWGGLSPRTATEVHEDWKLGIATAKNRLTQLAGLYDLCWKTVEGMDSYQHFVGFSAVGGSMDKEKVKDIATTLFIQSVREGLADKMPIRTTEKFYKEGGQDHPEHANQEEPADSDIPF